MSRARASMHVYTSIQFAARRAATVPFTTGLSGFETSVFVFLSATVRCVRVTSILWSLGDHLGVLGLHFGCFGARGQGPGLLWGHFGDGVHL